MICLCLPALGRVICKVRTKVIRGSRDVRHFIIIILASDRCLLVRYLCEKFRIFTIEALMRVQSRE